jgi:periplasmic divalent cation tolerance protein
MTDKIIALSTCGSADEAERLARLLVDRRLAACVNILAPVRSIYRWEGKVEDVAEWLLFIKTSLSRFEELSETVRAAHSYQLPEIVALPLIAGFPAYLDWLEEETRGHGNDE